SKYREFALCWSRAARQPAPMLRSVRQLHRQVSGFSFFIVPLRCLSPSRTGRRSERTRPTLFWLRGCRSQDLRLAVPALAEQSFSRAEIWCECQLSTEAVEKRICRGRWADLRGQIA